MEEQSIESRLQLFFSKATRSDWKKIAMQETNGSDPFAELSWRNKDNLIFSPYYDHDDIQPFKQLCSPDTPAAATTLLRRWLNIPAVDTSDVMNANLAAVEHVSNGADGAWFDLRKTSDADIGSFIANKSLADSHLFFALNEYNSDIAEKLFQQLNDQADVRGALFWDSIPKINSALSSIKQRKSFRWQGILVQASSPANEIASALTNGVKAFELARETSSDDAPHAVCFSLPADVSFLETVAKLKALRRLWYQIVQSYGHHDYKPHDLHIHVRSERATDGQYAPREDMLKATFESMAAVIGCCDSLTVFGTMESPLFKRWSRNLSNVLHEESFLGHTNDPLAGSYAVEAMTDTIAKEAWQLFQSNMQI